MFVSYYAWMISKCLDDKTWSDIWGTRNTEKEWQWDILLYGVSDSLWFLILIF